MSTRTAVALTVLAIGAAYVAALAVGYYFHRGGIERHHFETGWIWLITVAAAVAFTSHDGTAARAMSTRVEPLRFIAMSGALVVLAFAAWWPALSIGFLSDDFVLRERARHGQLLGANVEFFRPAVLVVFEVLGGRPGLLHALNLALHGMNAALVAALALDLQLPLPAACTAGVLFALFPACAEAVAWCAGVQDVLMTTAVLAAVLCARRSRPAPAAAAFTVGLMAKETAVAAPLLLAATAPRRWRIAAAGMALAAVFAVVRLALIPPSPGVALAPTLYGVKEVLSRSLATLAVPFHGSLVDRYPWLGAALAMLVALLLARAAWTWRRDRAAALRGGSLAMWVCLSVAPAYALLDITGSLQGSRYVYLAACGWSMLIASLLFATRSRVNIAVAAGLAALWMAGVRMNLEPWLDAARRRDEALASAARAHQVGCSIVWAAEPLDSVRGAYLFRNGLAEAVAPLSLETTGPEVCRIDPPAAR